MRALLLLFLAPATWATTELSAETLPQLLGASPGVRVLQERLKSAEALKGRLTRSFLPRLSVSFGRERFTTGPYHVADQSFGGVSAEVNLFNAGRDDLEEQRRSTEAQIAGLDLALAERQLHAELKRALAHHAYLEELRAITEKALAQNAENLQRAQKRSAAGLATATDLLDFRQQKTHLGQELRTLDYELGATQRLLNTLLGAAPERPLRVRFSNAHPEHGEEARALPRAEPLPVRRIVLEARAQELQLRREERWWAPSLDLYGYAQRFTQKEREYTPSDARNDVTFGLRLSFPLFDGGEALQAARAGRALVAAKRSELRGQQLELERRAQDAEQKLALAHDLIHGAEENVAIMVAYQRGVLSEYTRGVKNSPDLLQAGQRWVEAHVQSAEVKKNYQFAKAEAEFLAQLR